MIKWRQIPKWKQYTQTELNLSTTITCKLPHAGQMQVLNSKARFKTLTCGRRWGKTQLGLIEILKAAHLQHKFCWWLVPSYLTAEEIWLELVEAVKDLKNVTISTSKRRIDLPKGGVIKIKSAHNPNKLRGAQATTRNLIDFA